MLLLIEQNLVPQVFVIRAQMSTIAAYIFEALFSYSSTVASPLSTPLR